MARRFAKPGPAGRRLPADVASFEIAGAMRRARVAFEAGDYATAVRVCKDILARHGDRPDALGLLGTIAQRTGANEVAIGVFNHLLTLDKSNAGAHLGLGEALMAAEDWPAAVGHFRKAAALEPANAEAQCGLGAALIGLGERTEALVAFRRARHLAPDHRLAAYMIAALEGEAGAEHADYVRAMFDGYARIFEAHVVKTLRYDVPRQIADALGAVNPAPFGRVLDLGCGTGLVAAALTGRAEAIDGVDLSAEMIGFARAKGVYRALHIAEIGEFLARPEARAAGYELVVAADVFIYVGRLEAVFAAIREVLPPGGLFAFSLEHAEAGDCVAQPSSRYAHGAIYIDRLAAASGFALASRQPATIRQQNNRPIPGRIDVLRRVAD
jgi:predicted TPR repeat methyltransferase